MKACLSIFIVLMILPVAQAEQVRLGVAGNFIATAKALAPLFEQQSGHELVLSGASTGKLYAQIVNGAPYDVLLAADEDHPQQLEAAGKVVTGTRFVYATGRIVLWSSAANPLDENSLADNGFAWFAIANPRIAPYGRAAQQALQNMDLWQAVKPKLVQGESITQAFQFVATGNAQLGFVALSQVLNPSNLYTRTHDWPVPENLYDP